MELPGSVRSYRLQMCVKKWDSILRFKRLFLQMAYNYTYSQMLKKQKIFANASLPAISNHSL